MMFSHGPGPIGSRQCVDSTKDNRREKRDAAQIEFAPRERAAANQFAAIMWPIARNRGCCGETFRREYAIGAYTVDFYCVSLKLIVEVDGAHHFTKEGKRHDARRDQYRFEEGYVAHRIPGYDLLRDSLSVRERLERAIDARRHA